MENYEYFNKNNEIYKTNNASINKIIIKYTTLSLDKHNNLSNKKVHNMTLLKL